MLQGLRYSSNGRSILCNIVSTLPDKGAHPSLSTLRNLAKALGATLVQLLADEELKVAGTRNVKKSRQQFHLKRRDGEPWAASIERKNV